MPNSEPPLKTVHVRLFASARAAAGVSGETLQLPHSASLRNAVDELADRHPDALPRVLRAASFLINGVAAREPSTPLPDAAELDVLPPFAGG